MNGASALAAGLLFAGGGLAGTAPVREPTHLPYDWPSPGWQAMPHPCLIALPRCDELFPWPQPCLARIANCRREFSVEPAQIVPTRSRAAEKTGR